METIPIGGNDYQSYATVAEADVYLGGSLNTDEWDALDADGKGRCLVTSTRTLSAIQWISTPPDDVIKPACIELANAFADNPDLMSADSTATKRLKAGSVEIESFRSDSLFGSAPFPPAVMALLQAYMPGYGDGGVGGAFSYDTDGDSSFEDEDRSTFNEGV